MWNWVTERSLSVLVIFLLLPGVSARAETVAPEYVEAVRTINTETARLLFKKGYPFVDVRGINDFNNGHIPGAYHLPLQSRFDPQTLHQFVPKDQPVVVYCNGIACMGSSIAAEKAVGWGWLNIFYYREGIKGWIQQGYAVQSVNP